MIERTQKRYVVNELGDRIKLEVTGIGGILTDVKEGFAQCPKPIPVKVSICTDIDLV